MSGIYIHIPFCKQACHYCDFHFSTSLKKKDQLLNALKEELILRKQEIPNHIETIYFGGGTPSILSNSEIESILATIYNEYSVTANPEITLEANPDDLSGNKIKELSDSQINRLSIGIQSFFEEDLKLMNRAHNAQEARESLEMATQYFENISIDLIYGIPGLSHEKWLKNIELALAYNLPHISSYALTVEPRTTLSKFIKEGKIPDVDDEVAQEQFYILVKELGSNGFINYEISNFGKPGCFSKNNTSYWLGKSYLGIGPSAHSFNGKSRRWNVANNTKYIDGLKNGSKFWDDEILNLNDRYNETIMTGLRTIWGVRLDKIEIDFGKEYRMQLIDDSSKFIKRGLLKLSEARIPDFGFEELSNNKDDKRLLVTENGKFFCDGIASDLFRIE